MPRPSYKTAIDAFVERNLKSSPGYMVVCGPRGCGKSTMVLDALRGRGGVIVKRFGNESDTKAMFQQLLSSFHTTTIKLTAEDDVKSLFNDVQRKHYPANPAWRPVIVAEVDRGITDDVIVEVSKALKRLGCDLAAAHVFLVLSDANAAFALPDDPSRQKMLWIEDLTTAEANTLLDLRKFFVGNAEVRQRLFDCVGTRVADLIAAVVEAEVANNPLKYDEGRLDTFIADRLRMAEDTVRRLMTLEGSTPKSGGVAFTRLVRDILGTDRDGLPEVATREYLVAPDLAARVFKRYHAVMYHQPTSTYRFHSVAHRRAAEKICGKPKLK